MSAAGGAPGPRPVDLWRILRERRRDPLSLHQHLRDTYGGIVHVRLGGLSQFLVSDPDAVRHILVDNAQNYTKGPGYALLATLMGRGLVTSEGEHWRAHRRVVQPALHRDRLAAFVPVMFAAAAEEAGALEAVAERRDTVDMYERMAVLGLRIVSRTVLGADVRDREVEVHRAVEVVFDQLKRLSTSNWRLLEFLPGGSRLRWIVPLATSFPTPAKRRLDEAIGVLDEVIYGLIARRRAESSRGDRPRDLIGLLLRASEEEGAGFSDEDVRDEAMTMFIAGHETVAATLTWTLYLLARHRGYQERIAAEAEEVLGADLASVPSLEDLPRLEEAHRVFLEALRLYPPVWRFSRWADGPDRIGGYDVPAGSVLNVSPYLLHRDPAHWTDPDRFDPGRFEPTRSQARSRGVYIPFGAGRRMCPGGSFATAEVQIVLATLLRRVAFEATGVEPRFDPRITLRPRGGMPLRVVPAGTPSPRTGT